MIRLNKIYFLNVCDRYDFVKQTYSTNCYYNGGKFIEYYGISIFYSGRLIKEYIPDNFKCIYNFYNRYMNWSD